MRLFPQFPTPAITRPPQQTSQDAHIPESTYEIFQQVFSVNSLSAPSYSHPAIDSVSILTEETGALLRLYQNGIGAWMDIFDCSHTYQNEVVMYSLSSPLLMHAVCALSARQMSLIDNKFLWEPVSSRFYGESLSLLIKELTEQSTDSELVLAGTILLGSYELLTQPGIDYQRHLYGAHTLILSRNIGEEGTPFEQASFWIYARQDVALALVNERPTLTPPAKWPAIPANAVPVEDWFGKKILWLLARVIEAKFTVKIEHWSSVELRDFEGLVSDIDLLWTSLPSHVRGIHMKHALFEDERLFRVWFHVPAASALCLYYHMAKILAYECLLEKSSAGSPPTGQTDVMGSIRHHARAIASICLSSDLADSALVVAVNPIFYSAKYLSSLALKTRLWGVLDHIETRMGFYTRDRQTQLQLGLSK
ncbi:hypothetical protein P170DRAFT_474364 [Aspergillus steynii IBT 23096]|uniref:Transcription factor domain-containing protein n=1 Tax=Aspergillus steynii IBT 23096 TaxID=1392250 RepID=A0A2I2GD72_9EURO|nr:uncharacterized protein P170DRAFT_474364 [Aspergillus steynii IBT 23096]PLB50810.1 hypothetical protein P170DRAFT_474364 [Aspergillus steynii IBT 23096]